MRALGRVGASIRRVLDISHDRGGSALVVRAAPFPPGAARGGVKLVAIGDGAPWADAHLAKMGGGQVGAEGEGWERGGGGRVAGKREEEGWWFKCWSELGAELVRVRS